MVPTWQGQEQNRKHMHHLGKGVLRSTSFLLDILTFLMFLTYFETCG